MLKPNTTSQTINNTLIPEEYEVLTKNLNTNPNRDADNENQTTEEMPTE